MTRSMAAILVTLLFQCTLAIAAQVTNDLKKGDLVLGYQQELDALMVTDPLAARETVAKIVNSLKSYMPNQLLVIREQLPKYEGTTIKLAISLILQKYWKIEDQNALATLKDLETIATEKRPLRRDFPNFTPKDLPYILPLIEHFTDHKSEFLNLSFFDLEFLPTPILALPWVKTVYVLDTEKLEKRELMPTFLGHLTESFQNLSIKEP